MATLSASWILSSGIVTKGSCGLNDLNWNKFIARIIYMNNLHYYKENSNISIAKYVVKISFLYLINRNKFLHLLSVKLALLKKLYD